MTPDPSDAPPTRRTVLDHATRMLADAGIGNAAREAAWIVTDVLGLDRAGLIGWPEAGVTPEEAAAVERLAARRARREPLQYVLGHADFRGRRFHVDPAVLIPRPETEEVVGHAVDLVAPGRPVRVLDVGTGSGCIAVSVALERPQAAVTACDVSPAALDVARSNAARLGAPVRFVEADALSGDFTTRVGGPFDVIVSNPPYVADEEEDLLPEEVVRHEPRLALFPPGDPLRFYRVLAALAAGALGGPDTVLVVEIHADRGGAVCDIFRAAGLAQVALRRDAAGRDRICTGVRASI